MQLRSASVAVTVLLALVSACGDSGQSEFSEFCRANSLLEVANSQLESADTPDEFEEAATSLVQWADQSVEVAPAEIRSETEREALVFHGFFRLAEDAGFDETRSDPAAAQAFLAEHEEEGSRASNTIIAWVADNC